MFHVRHRRAELRTALVCVTPGGTILSTADAKANLRVATTDEDGLIDGLALAATQKLDGGDGDLKRALLTQSWTLVLPRFWHHWSLFNHHVWDRIDLPLPPLQSVDSIKYLDLNGAEQTLDTSIYRVVNCGTETSFVMRVQGQSWPATQCVPDAVRIAFTAGYGASAADVPVPIVQAAKLLVGHFYENREAVADKQDFVMPKGVDDLVRNYRIVRM